MKSKQLRSSLLIVVVSSLMFGCPWLESVDQPTIVSTDSSFTSTLRITMGDAVDYNGLAHMAIQLPDGWMVTDSIPYTGCTEGIFVLDSFITDTVSARWPAEPGYYWWGGIATDTMVCVYENPIEIRPHFQTSMTGGEYTIDYRLGDNNSYQAGSGFLALRDSTHIFSMPQADLYGDIYVNPEGSWGGEGTIDDPLKTISEALFRLVADSINPGSIYLANGDYLPEYGGERFPLSLKSYTSIVGESEAGVILDADGIDRVFEIYSLQDVSLGNLTITGGQATDGGGISCSFSDIILSNVTFSENQANGRGGGFFCQNSNPQLTNVTFSNNSAYWGGGIYSVNSDPGLTEVNILENSADYGGGIYLANSSPALTEVNLSENDASQDGGGLFCSNANPTLNSLTLSENVARRGGGAYCTNSDPIFLDVSFLNNQGFVDGGGIFIESSEIDINEMVLRNNFSGTGGGMYISNSNLSMSNVTISQNTAGVGGGFYCDDSSSVVFSLESRCNIYSNINEGYGGGQEIVSYSQMNVVLDTCTVMLPTAYHASPRANFTFDILSGLYEQIDSDIYIAVDGDDANDGESQDTPLKTLQHAMEVILADSVHPRMIYLADGLYSPQSTGERFPINIVDHVSLLGQSTEGVVLDATGTTYEYSGGIGFKDVNHSTLSNLTITGTRGYENPAIKCDASSPKLHRLLISDYMDGGIHCDNSNPIITHVTVAAGFGGAVVSGNNSSPVLINSILWNIGSDEINFFGTDSSSILIAYSNIHQGVFGVGPGENHTVIWADGNIDLNPVFNAFYQGDFYLQETSPCIDMGTSLFIWNNDTLLYLESGEYVYDAPDIGVFESPYAVGIHDENLMPEEFALHQNFPNPFNPATLIRYELPQRADVSIIVYDIMGQQIVSLVSENQSAGYHSIKWNGKDRLGHQASTGMYLYVIHASDFAQTRKMLLLK
ncbi:MAG: DUF1565 domain-containing protein [Candidatus Marinimicrobia bacterium]|jgi:predicted outer membrane repeat protein|nr:DUF1565 domain-containing protein [Candidatus Neomarinimicrobiota bacterium]MBT4129910.1 DUF1565 domain-containing protein [Candidatus Neomarinimicrobiota bacterium]MBT4294205.1 DUF1565 domain-containing protein [Candidatus Neomarinimicrobiota bacterium]MBT4418979.1 DUF1565 domain-containing protein [Candidatus Neomarinimicrobiota bacterium]MBT4993189.1 DUF1565 domain-containing protein [Candidatus Neomarinimicrobiota bacterium]